MSTEAKPEEPTSVAAEPQLAAAEKAIAHCPAVTIETAADLENARACRVIDGDLRIRSPELEAITDADLPKLERVTGSLISVGGQKLRELSLPSLREVGEDSSDSLQIALDGKHLQRIALPRLEHVTGGVGIYGLYALEELDLSALEQLDGALVVATLPKLHSLRLSHDLRVGGSAEFQLLCAMPYADVAVPAGSVVLGFGCCTESSEECGTVQCTCGDEPSMGE